MPTVAERLRALLPGCYRHDDDTGDLWALLQIIGPTFDELRAKILSFPELAGPDTCPDAFLPALGALVAAVDASDTPPAPWKLRRDIRQAVESHRRLGTLPGLRRALEALGWSGEIIERGDEVLRLNASGRLNSHRLPGQHYNAGIYVVTGIDQSDLQAGALRLNTRALLNSRTLVGLRHSSTVAGALGRVLARHQPAGTRMEVQP